MLYFYVLIIVYKILDVNYCDSFYVCISGGKLFSRYYQNGCKIHFAKLDSINDRWKRKNANEM